MQKKERKKGFEVMTVLHTFLRARVQETLT
jgi:hypothetical protein